MISKEEIKLKKQKMKLIRREQRDSIILPEVTILSNTCLGGRLYHDYNARFLSPTIDCYIPPEDFIRFASDLKGYLAENIILIQQNVKKGFIPTMLGDIHLYFAHSNTDFKTAEYNWNKRKERIVWDNIRCICTDRNTVFCKPTNCGIEIIKRYSSIPYTKKVIFSVLQVENECVSFLKSFEDRSCCPEATLPSLLHPDRYIVENDGFNLDDFIIC